MTLSTSLFNKGIYKNIISRFKWGSFLYFVALFFCVPFALLVQSVDVLTRRYIDGNYMGLLLTRGDYAILPMILAVAVPTVAAVLVYGFVHSQKQGIFIHSLPAKRSEIYVSSLLAAFTLMGVPVILNGLILLMMSFSAYSKLIYTWTVFYWMAEHLSILFIMFSVATLAAYLTGNAAANIGINVLLHVVPILVALAIFLISEELLFGFVSSDSFIANEIISNTPIVWLFSKIHNTDIFKELEMWFYLVGAAALYFAAYLLYKNRKIEACGDVAAFEKFRPILKYTVVTAAAIVIFGILASSGLGTIPMFIVAITVTCIVYFASEMLMNKTFKVFGTYKGYLAFLVCGGLFISFFAYTSVFGYETRIPETSDIVKATVYENIHPRVPYVTSENDIEVVRNIHKGFVSDVGKREKDPKEYYGLYVEYELKNGKTLERWYKAKKDEYVNALSDMYDIKSYKLEKTGIENINIDKVNNIDIHTSFSNFSYGIDAGEKAPQILYAIEKDLDVLSYKEIKVDSNAMELRVSLELSAKDNEKLGIFKRVGTGREKYEYYHESFNIGINSNFKNTIAVLKELGIYDEFINRVADNAYICKNAGTYSEGALSYKEDVGEVEEFMVSPNDLIKIDKLDGRIFAEEMFTKLQNTDKGKEIEEGKGYFVFIMENTTKENVWLSSYAASYKADELPEYLKKYVI